MTTELLINKDVSKRDVTLHDECIFNGASLEEVNM
jgi:hypothetical protein